MANQANPPSHESIAQRVERILAVGEVNRPEYFQLMSIFLSDFAVTRDDRYQLNRIFDELQMNRLQFADRESDTAAED
ncbi:MAG: hypothetical protein ACLFT0_01915 [Spirulinaceae cyanobacterium]